MEQITNVFLQDHHKIAELIFDLELDTATAAAIEKLSVLKKALERHFAVEELLYNRHSALNSGGSRLVKNILHQHREILDRVRHAEEEWGRGNAEDLTDTVMMLNKHRLTEEKLLYPAFERVLSPQEKEQVLLAIRRESLTPK